MALSVPGLVRNFSGGALTVQGTFPVPQPLAAKVDTIRRQLGLREGVPMIETISQALSELGISADRQAGLTLQAKADLCLREIGAAPTPMTMQQTLPIGEPIQMAEPVMAVPVPSGRIEVTLMIDDWVTGVYYNGIDLTSQADSGQCKVSTITTDYVAGAVLCVKGWDNQSGGAAGLFLHCTSPAGEFVLKPHDPRCRVLSASSDHPPSGWVSNGFDDGEWQPPESQSVWGGWHQHLPAPLKAKGCSGGHGVWNGRRKHNFFRIRLDAPGLASMPTPRPRPPPRAAGARSAVQPAGAFNQPSGGFSAYDTEGCFVGACLVPCLVTMFRVKADQENELTASGLTLPCVLCPWSYKLNQRGGDGVHRFELRAGDQNQDWDFNCGGCCLWATPGWWAVKVLPSCVFGGGRPTEPAQPVRTQDIAGLWMCCLLTPPFCPTIFCKSREGDDGLSHNGLLLFICPFEEKRTRHPQRRNGFKNGDPNNVDEYCCGSAFVCNGPSMSIRLCPPPGCPP